MKLFLRSGVQLMVGMNQKVQRWTVAELVPLILLGLVGVIFLLAAPARPIPSKTHPSKRPPRISPAKPPLIQLACLRPSGVQPGDGSVNTRASARTS